MSGQLRLHIHTADGGLVVDEDAYTLYDAREHKKPRTEWHLYYASADIGRHAAPGDLLVLFRPDESDDLFGIVASKGSTVEAQLLELLELGKDFDLERFLVVDPPDPSPTRAGEAAVALSLWDEPDVIQVDRPYVPLQHPIVARAIAEGQVPGTAEMAAAAAELVAGLVDPAAQPDEYLVRAMQSETDLFFGIEEAVAERRLETILDVGRSVPEVLRWAMSVHQARRSRRGQSLQLHFARILEARRIPHSPQCTTEPGETPDFVVPGCAEYHDPGFPAERLRMVACKTTSKERWRQILNEAIRIRPKYLLTVDPGLTAPTLEQMHEAGLIPYLPAAAIESAYAANPLRSRLGTVADLLRALEAVSL